MSLNASRRKHCSGSEARERTGGDFGQLVAARNRALKDAWERDVIHAPDWSDLVSTEDAVLDALEKIEKEEGE